MQVVKVLNESNRILQEKEDWFKKILNVEEDKFNRQYIWIQDLEKQIKRLREIVGEKNNDIQKAKDELKQKGQSHEMEVILRMQFEERLTHLHSLNRSFSEAVIRYKMLADEK